MRAASGAARARLLCDALTGASPASGDAIRALTDLEVRLTGIAHRGGDPAAELAALRSLEQLHYASRRGVPPG
jgi:hypothetical protein